jgi:octaprenyl-diphosphate synthase
MVQSSRQVRSIKTIKRPIEKELKTFEQRFREDMRSHVPLLDKITYYIVQRKGKQVRPMFVFLCAKICGEIHDASYHAASLVELLHTATLVHDDVVDDSNESQGFFSLNAIWKNKIAVLVGDYLLQKGFLIALKNKRFELLEIVAEAVKEMSEGKLLFISRVRKFDFDEKNYLEIVRKKTASLISAACSAGATSSTEDTEVIRKMKFFGEKIGVAFQLRDELFDFVSNGTSKPLGIDLKEKGISLPLVFALNQASDSEQRKIINHINNDEKLKEVVAFVKASGGIEYAQKVMQKYRQEASEILQSLPASDARKSLEDLVDYVIERKR